MTLQDRTSIVKDGLQDSNEICNDRNENKHSSVQKERRQSILDATEKTTSVKKRRYDKFYRCWP